MVNLVKDLRDRARGYRIGGPSAAHTAVMLENAADEIERLRVALERAAKELELLYFFAISNGIPEAGVPPHVAARAALEEK